MYCKLQDLTTTAFGSFHSVPPPVTEGHPSDVVFILLCSEYLIYLQAIFWNQFQLNMYMMRHASCYTGWPIYLTRCHTWWDNSYYTWWSIWVLFTWSKEDIWSNRLGLVGTCRLCFYDVYCLWCIHFVLGQIKLYVRPCIFSLHRSCYDVC